MIQDKEVSKNADDQIDCVHDSKKQTKLEFFNKGNHESSHGLSEIEIVDFKGKSFAALNCTFFESVMLSHKSGQVTFQTRDNVFFQSESCVFFLAVQPADNKRPQAIVFNLNEHAAALVSMFELVISEQEGGIDPEQF